MPGNFNVVVDYDLDDAFFFNDYNDSKELLSFCHCEFVSSINFIHLRIAKDFMRTFLGTKKCNLIINIVEQEQKISTIENDAVSV